MTRRPRRAGLGWIAGALLLCSWPGLRAQETYVYLTDVPDYTWYAGCFGTACGNLAGFWDRHGMEDFYTGPTAEGVAPLDTCAANFGIRSMIASKAGLDGRPAGRLGHIDDYWSSYGFDLLNCGRNDSFSYQSTSADPYFSHWPEHPPDCIADFIGLNQKKWTNLNNECAGNIDAFSFVFWEKKGMRRINNYTTNGGVYIPDIASGLKEWARYRGYDADVFTQLSSFNPERRTANGFTYADVKAEILAGYPVLCMLQPTNQFSRNIGGMTNANPEIHGVMIYGLLDAPSIGFSSNVLIRTSWGSGYEVKVEWGPHNWLGLFPVRGVIGFHPKPKVRRITRSGGNVTLTWDGPSSQLHDAIAGTNSPPLQRYRVQRATTLSPPNWTDVSPASPDRTATVPDDGASSAFYRVKLLP